MDLQRKFSHDEEIVDSVTPLNAKLSAKYLRSFAYFTVNSRLPVILTKVIDSLARDKEHISKQHGEGAINELKDVIGAFSKLKNELQTNKPFVPLISDGSDVELWNKYLEERTKVEQESPRWYSTIWLYAECYMYRRFRESFELSKTLKTFDPFRQQKEVAVLDSMPAMAALAEHLLRLVEKSELMSRADIKSELLRLLMVNLWGNCCDLSISLGEKTESTNLLLRLDQLKNNILVNDSEKIWARLISENKSGAEIAFICDNAGYEVFTDLVLADFLISFSLADQVVFHLKAMPWFVSDVMHHDFHWLVSQLSASTHATLNEIANRWKSYLDSGKWLLRVSNYWTMPYDFHAMREVDGELYSELARAKLLLVKGDLNYRKLCGETNWRPTASFHDALAEFHPTSIAALRTIKCDLIAGLDQDQAEDCFAKDPHWMREGEYGVIQFDGSPFEFIQCCSVAARLLNGLHL